MRVFVAGIGVISSLGAGVKANFHKLLNMQHGLENKSTYIDSSTDFNVGTVPLSNEELSALFGINIKLSRTSLLSLYAVNECLKNFSQTDCRLGFISGTTVGGMDKSEKFFKEYVPRSTGKVEDIIYHTCGSATTSIVPYLPAIDFVSTINTACSSAANAIITGARKIKQDALDAVIAGGGDSLCRFTLNGFNSLMILDKELCRPMDESRAGLNLGEGAGYLLLVSEKLLNEQGLTPLCELKGYANTNDAFHATALSDTAEGPYLAIKQTLESAAINPNEVDYINLHGTGTQNNDLAESTAILKVFGENYPSLSSTKTFTGHTLGASGGIEAVFSVLAITEQKVFPNLNFKTPMETGIIPVLQTKEQSVKTVLSNSFGFGGNCSSLLFTQ